MYNNLTDEQLKHNREVMEELKNYDTPSITNVIATYPSAETCLGLYNPWYGKWYTDQSCKPMFPELGRMIGYAVTCVYGLPDEHYKRGSLVGEVFDAVKESPQPVVLIVKQDMPEEIKARNGLLGGCMMTAFKNAGAVAVISDGASRDIDEIRPMRMQYMLTGASAGHGVFELQAVNVPVEVCNMQVCTGDIIHMDENGAVKFPMKYLDEVLKRVKVLAEEEVKKQMMLSKAASGAEVDRILSGQY